MKIVYFGNGVRGLKCLEALIGTKEDIVAIVGHFGEGSSVVEYAKHMGLPTFQPANVNAPEFIERLKEFEAQLFILSGFNKIFKADIMRLPEKGCINLHGGRLPEYRGAAPINWQIINGEKTGGCCIIYIDDGIDNGPIISQKFYEIREDDTAADIINKQLGLFPSMLLDAVQRIKKGTVNAVPQDGEKSRYYARRYPCDSQINWKDATAQQVYNLVRALVDPYPNAFTFFEGKKVRIRKARRVKPPVRGVPGRLPLKTSEGVIICCKDEGLLITEVAFEKEETAYNPKDIFQTGINFETQ